MKKLVYILAVILVSFSLATPVLAAPAAYVVDEARLLTAAQKADLEESVRKVRNKFNFDVVIVTLKDAKTNKNQLVFTADYYMNNGYGVGSSHDGLILLLDMKARDWSIVGTGHGQKVFTGWGTKDIGERILPDLKNGNYYEAFGKYIQFSEIFLQAYKDGKPISETNPYLDSSFYRLCAILTLLAAICAAFMTRVFLMRKMNMVLPQYDAFAYTNDSILAGSEDIFLYDKVTSTKIIKPPSGSGGSGTGNKGSFRSSSGSSHSGSGGKF